MSFFKKIKDMLLSNNKVEKKSDIKNIDDNTHEYFEDFNLDLYPWGEPQVIRYYDLLEKSRKLYPDRKIERVYKELIIMYEEMLNIVIKNKNIFDSLKEEGIFIDPFKQYHLLYIFHKEYHKAIALCERAIEFFNDNDMLTYYKKEINLINKKIDKIDKITTPTKHAQSLANNNLFDEWIISISFGKSTSANYKKALFLAKNAPKYDEVGEDRELTHQAIYTSSENDFNNFVTLYEIVKGWKSTFFFLNGKYIA